jgi:hypothetical protein
VNCWSDNQAPYNMYRSTFRVLVEPRRAALIFAYSAAGAWNMEGANGEHAVHARRDVCE